MTSERQHGSWQEFRHIASGIAAAALLGAGVLCSAAGIDSASHDAEKAGAQTSTFSFLIDSKVMTDEVVSPKTLRHSLGGAALIIGGAVFVATRRKSANPQPPSAILDRNE